MTLVDANVLLYAVNASATQHQPARRWLDRALSGGAPVEFAWMALLAFVRVSTHSSIFTSPLSTDEAMEQVADWLSSTSARVVHPGPRHPDILTGLLSTAGRGGNLVNDAHLAALAIEHRLDLASFDRDFDRFAGVRRLEPN